MKIEKGKIFNTQEVQAIIAGNKTMFREVVKTCKQHPNNVCRKVRNGHYGLNLKEDGLFWQPYGGSELQPFPYCDSKLSASTSLDEFCPYQVGQKIFCKESFAEVEVGAGMGYNTGKAIIRRADDDYDVKWKPAQHMKQEHSRITLLIKSIKVERLRDISESDVMKEGCYLTEDDMGQPIFGFCKEEVDQELGYRKAQNAYKIYWNSNHKKQEQKWEANPWVWVVDFKINK